MDLYCIFIPRTILPAARLRLVTFAIIWMQLKSYSVVGVSKDDLKSHKKFIEKQNLNFDLLSDAETDLVEKFGVWQEKKMMGKKYMGIVRTTFLISKDGKILKIYENVKVKDHVAEIIKDIKELK